MVCSELYRVLFATAGRATDRLVAPPLVIGQNVGAFAATPDSANVVYIANRLVASKNQLFIVPAGGGGSIQLNEPTRADEWKRDEFCRDAGRALCGISSRSGHSTRSLNCTGR